jgi:hypothetical protein
MREEETLYPLYPEVGRRELNATKNGKSKTSVLPKVREHIIKLAWEDVFLQKHI